MPVVLKKGRSKTGGIVANALEDVEKLAVPVDMAFGDLPVVRAGVARLAGIKNNGAVLEGLEIDIERLPADAVRGKVDRRGGAVLGRVIVLKTGRHFDHLTFNIGCDPDKAFWCVAVAYEFVEGTDTGDI